MIYGVKAGTRDALLGRIVDTQTKSGPTAEAESHKLALLFTVERQDMLRSAVAFSKNLL